MTTYRIHRAIIFLVLGLLFFACKPTIPGDAIQPDDMEDLLYDYYVAQGINSDYSQGTDYRLQYNYGLVFKKYGVTEAQFDSSMVYYYNHLEDLYKIYERVQKRLSEDALKLGASSSEVERYMTHSLSGDTADIWTARRHQILFPQSPYNIYQFSLKADTACHSNDSYMLTFGCSFLVQSGSRNATALLSVVYENDSIITQSISVPLMGIAKVNIPICSLRPKEFKGYLYMGMRQGQDNDNDMCMFMADHIQLIRFHHPELSATEAQTDADKNASLTTDTIRHKPDSLKPKIHKLGERPVTSKLDADPSNQRKIEPLTKKQ